MLKSVRLLAFLLCAVGLIGCASYQRIRQNSAAGHDVALLLWMNQSMDGAGVYPESLAILQAQLETAGVQTAVPKCLCADGTLRDFIYVPGLASSDGPSFVVLASPEEMDSRKTIVVGIDCTARVVSRAEAASEVIRSQALAKEKNPKK